MRYKITYKNKSYIVKATDTRSALDGLSVVVPELNDDRLSPMTYKKLKELGYDHEKWKDLSQEQANKIVQQNKPETESTKKEELSSGELSEKQLSENVNSIIKKYGDDKNTKIGAITKRPDGSYNISVNLLRNEFPYQEFDDEIKQRSTNILKDLKNSLNGKFNISEKKIFKGNLNHGVPNTLKLVITPTNESSKNSQTEKSASGGGSSNGNGGDDGSKPTLSDSEYQKRIDKYKQQSKPYVDKINSIFNSKEAKNLAKQIQTGNYYNVDDIKKFKFVKDMDDAIADYDNKFGYTLNDNSEEREQERNYVKNKLLERGSYNGKDANGKPRWDGELKHEGKVVIAIGLPASGKSTLIAEPRSQQMGAYILDSDEAKFLDPRFVATNGLAANSIHKDSQNIVKSVRDTLIKDKTNLVIPVIGDNYDNLVKKWIQPLLDAGYKKEDIEIDLKDANLQQSINRAMRRAVEKNRPIKSDVVLGYTDPKNSLNIAKQNGFKTKIIQK